MDLRKLHSLHLFFFLLDPTPLHSIQRSGGAPGSLGFGVKKWYFFKRSGRGSNLGPWASKKDALSTPLRPTWLWEYTYNNTFPGALNSIVICMSTTECHMHDMSIGQMTPLKWNITCDTGSMHSISFEIILPLFVWWVRRSAFSLPTYIGEVCSLACTIFSH